jgi:hypothetical protein
MHPSQPASQLECDGKGRHKNDMLQRKSRNTVDSRRATFPQPEPTFPQAVDNFSAT